MTVVELLRVGDMIDLEGDPYADVGDDPDEFMFSYAEVSEPVELEVGYREDGQVCVLVHTSLGSFGFPLGHLVNCIINSDTRTAVFLPSGKDD